jgi:hypothetical protein
MKRRNLLIGGACCGAAAIVGLARWNKAPRHYCDSGGDYQKLAIAMGQKRKWGKNYLQYHINGRDTEEMKPDIWDAEFRMAFDAWSEVTPLTFEQTDVGYDADIMIDVSGREKFGFGRSGDILAWAQLPSNKNFDGTLWSVFDLAENWILPEANIMGVWPPAGIILRAVACHEIGHLLGLRHSIDPNALMYPYLNNVLKPREDDIRRIQLLYGKKR